MSEPKRLSSGDDLGAALLSSARADVPRASSRATTAAALGLGMGAVVGAAAIASGGAAKAAGASIAPKAIGAGTGLGAKAASALWLKLLAASVVTVAVVGGVAVKAKLSAHHADATLAERGQRDTRPTANGSPPAPVQRGTSSSQGELAPAVAVAAPEMTTVVNSAPEAPTPVATPVATPAAEPPAATAAAPRAEPPRSAPRGATVASTTSTMAAASPAPAESPLGRELRSLDDARSALARGDASGALAELDRHDRAFPAGTLRTEANVLRVEALVAQGDRAAARRLATQLLARDPSGPHARRLRTIADAP